MNYTQLLSSVADLMHRSDLTSVIPNFVMIVEAKLNRHLRVRQMETVLAATPITDGVVTLASDIADVKSLWVPGYEGTPLKRQSIDSVISRQVQTLSTMYARRGARDLLFDGAGSVQGVLYQKIPALSDTNTSNWLLDDHPDVYLYGALVEASIYTKQDASVYSTQYQTALNEVASNEERFTGPLIARAR